MKKTILASLFAAAMLPAFAFAADGTVNFTGEVTQTTCVPATGSTTQNVILNKISASALADGKLHGYKDFTISLVNCGSTSKSVAVQFDGTTNVDFVTGYLKNTMTGSTAATNVEIALADSNFTTLKLPVGTSVPVTTQADGTAIIPMYAAYVQNGGTAGAGQIASSTTFSIIYP
jgi:major type 1 subunit fimbrin (pilin)